MHRVGCQHPEEVASLHVEGDRLHRRGLLELVLVKGVIIVKHIHELRDGQEVHPDHAVPDARGEGLVGELDGLCGSFNVKQLTCPRGGGALRERDPILLTEQAPTFASDDLTEDLLHAPELH